MTVRRIRKLLRGLTGNPRLRCQTISVKQAASLFRGLPPTEVTILTRTEAREVGPGHDLGPLRAVKLRKAVLNVQYEDAINYVREAEGLPPRQPRPRSWGENVGLPFVANYKDGVWKLYLSVIETGQPAAPIYHDRFGNAVAAELVTPFLKERVRRAELPYRNIELKNVLAVVTTGPRGGLHGHSIVEEVPRRRKRRLVTSAGA